MRRLAILEMGFCMDRIRRPRKRSVSGELTAYTSPLSSYTVTTGDAREFPCRLRAGLMAGDTAETNLGTVTVVRTQLTDAGWAA